MVMWTTTHCFDFFACNLIINEYCLNIIGVTRPAIVREIPHFHLLPHSSIFARTSRISGFISK